MFSQKTKIQICAKNLAGVEHDLTAIDFTGLDLVGAVNDGTPPVIGDTTVTVDGFTTNIPTGCIIGFAGDDTTYYVSTGASSTSITIDPPLRTNLADNQVVTIYPHFDISQYVTSVSNLSQRAEYNQAELIFDKPISYTLFNKNSVFYDRDTHSTGWGLTTAYFSTYNAQSDTDNQYVRISILRSGTWYQKYVGKIVRYSFELDEINRSVSFDTESIFYTLKDTLVSQIDDLYNLHKYTSTTRKTKTPSGKYVDVIRALFNSVGVQSKSFTVTYKEKTNHVCKLTTSVAHNIQVGELITVDISDINFDVYSAIVLSTPTSTTLTYTKTTYDYGTSTDDGAGYAIGATTVVLATALSGAPTGASQGIVAKWDNDTTIFDVDYYDIGAFSVDLSPALAVGLTAGAPANTISASWPTKVASTAASGTLTTHRVVFDLSTDYFNITHQGHAYDLNDLWWITEKWMVEDVEAENGFGLMGELCVQLNACANIDYVDGVVYGFFRSKVNTSSSKITLTNSKLIGEMRTGGNWRFCSQDGLSAGADVVYWNGESLISEFCYAEDLGAGDYQRFLSETPSTTVLSYDRYSPSVCADSFNNLVVDDKFQIVGDDTIYTVTSVASDVIGIEPTLRKSAKLGAKIAIYKSKKMSLLYPNVCNIKLKYPNIFLVDTTNKTVRRYWNNGTATPGIHPIAYYTSEIIYTSANVPYGISYSKLCPVADGTMNIPSGDNLFFSESVAGDGSIKTLKSSLALPQDGLYTIRQLGAGTGIEYYNLETGFISGKNEIDNTIKLYRVVLAEYYDTGINPNQIAILSVEMDNIGDSAEIVRKYRPIRRGFVSENDRRAPGLTDEQVSSGKYVLRNDGLSSVTTNENEFGYYKLTLGQASDTVTAIDGYIGTGNVNSIFLNQDVLNPDYDELIYADAGHASCIRKIQAWNATGADDVFTGTPPTANTIENFIVNHGESTAQEFYWYNNSDYDIYKNTGADWSGATSVFSGSIGLGNHITRWGKQDLSYQITGPLQIKKCYDNILVVADLGETTLSLMDLDSSTTFCIDDTSGDIDSIGQIDVQCFTNWYNYQGATNPTIFENDICFNASKLAYKFYSKNRRVLECNVRDADMGYIDYTLFDRFTVDSSILSAASGSPKFYVYAYDFNWQTHDQKLTLLESVE